MDVRCEHKMHGRLTDGGLFEVKCDSGFCGAAPGVVVLHLFSILTGELVETKRFKAAGTHKAPVKRNRRVA